MTNQQYTEPYVIRKHGMFYRPNSRGYTYSIFEAGLYEKEDALKEAKMCDEITVMPVSQWFDSDKELKNHLDQAEAIRDCLWQIWREKHDQ